jgi:hypothetical protein
MGKPRYFPIFSVHLTPNIAAYLSRLALRRFLEAKNLDLSRLIFNPEAKQKSFKTNVTICTCEDLALTHNKHQQKTYEK